MKITKVLALFLALVMLFGAVACTRKDPEDSNADNITGTNPGVSMGFLGNSEVLNNLFYNVGVKASSPESSCAINIAQSINVKISDNASYHDTKDSRHKVLVESGNEGIEKSANRYYVLD